jgi:hypothetical protein
MPGFREGLARAQADEARHLTYGMYLLSRLVAADADVWGAVSQRMENLLPLTLGIVSEFFAAYDPMPFGLTLEDIIQDATGRFAERWAALEGARERSRAHTVVPEANETVRAVLGWVGDQLQPVPVDLRRDRASPVYAFHIGPTGTAVLLITQEVLGQYASTDIIEVLRAHRVPERLRAGGRTRLTCLSARGKILVQPAD